MLRKKKTLFGIAAVLVICLGTDAFLPPDRQPSAYALEGMICAYQVAGAPAAEFIGIRCRYEPSCSHYALEAIERTGTWRGMGLALGRVMRCAPWGGCGYDPVPGDDSDDRKWARGEWPLHRQRDGAGMTACALGCFLMGALGGLALFIAAILIMVWVYNDAKARGDQNPGLWVLIVFFSHVLVGLIIYLIVRPKGALASCPRCRGRKLETLVKCPHCGVDAGGPSAAPS